MQLPFGVAMMLHKAELPLSCKRCLLGLQWDKESEQEAGVSALSLLICLLRNAPHIVTGLVAL